VRLGQDIEYCKHIINYGRPTVIGIAMDGGYNDDLYEKINGARLAKVKLQAIENLASIGYKRVSLTTTIVRNLNESSIDDLFDIVKNRYPKNVRGLNIRSQLEAGKHIDAIGYVLTELQKMVFPHVNLTESKFRIDGSKGPNGEKCFQCCNEFVWKGIRIKIIDCSATSDCFKCWLKGKLIRVPDGFDMASFYDNIRERIR
jgi:molybdenum cofactor biosynthesis enzyme MoaA